MQKIGGAVERIDDPAMRLVGALLEAAFLAEEAVAGPRLGELGAQNLLGAMVGRGDEIGGALQRDLQLLDLAEVALEAAAGLARRRGHDIEKGGPQHEDIDVTRGFGKGRWCAWPRPPRQGVEGSGKRDDAAFRLRTRQDGSQGPAAFCAAARTASGWSAAYLSR